MGRAPYTVVRRRGTRAYYSCGPGWSLWAFDRDIARSVCFSCVCVCVSVWRGDCTGHFPLRLTILVYKSPQSSPQVVCRKNQDFTCSESSICRCYIPFAYLDTSRSLNKRSASSREGEARRARRASYPTALRSSWHDGDRGAGARPRRTDRTVTKSCFSFLPFVSLGFTCK